MDRTSPVQTIAIALRRERDRLGVSLAELARRAGIAKSTLSQLEAAAGNPSVETLWALAVALDVPFSRLVDPPTRPVRVIRSGEGHAIASNQARFTSTLLAACPPGARRDLHVITGEPGTPRRAHAHLRGTIEHLLVTAGRWQAGPEGEEVELGPGDYVCFPGDQPHRYVALEPGAAAVLIMEYV
ncbi:helix-turn-helix domain-containing protein [Pseudonocardia hispaniensis]|uniref:Helix-turn-helix domain-containing protein n=1 Tax=Pseudonocardia hispaniensis TaxID=904933 RepID=A0ABW1J0D3_9PSEU